MVDVALETKLTTRDGRWRSKRGCFSHRPDYSDGAYGRSVETEFGMDLLVEVHGIEELEQAAQLRFRLIGINDRDLKTMGTTLATAQNFAPQVPEGKVVVGENGLRNPEDLKCMTAAGITAFLVGESPARVPDVESATLALLAQ